MELWGGEVRSEGRILERYIVTFYRKENLSEIGSKIWLRVVLSRKVTVVTRMETI